MSDLIVVDDQATRPNSNIPVINYFPTIPEGWRNQGICIGCNISHPAAQDLLYRTAAGGTWTNAWWATGQTRVTASLDFEGTSVSAYFVFFWRSEDPNSQGKGSLQFFIDSELKQSKAIDVADYTFEYDISPRTLMFQQDNLDPGKRHRFTAAWVNDGPRPRVAVALDSIEYLAIPTSSAAPTPSSSSPDATSASPLNITTIVAPIVSVLGALLVGVGFFLWYRCRQRPLFPPGSPELDPFVETSEGRRYYNVSGPLAPFTHHQPGQPQSVGVGVGPYPGEWNSGEGRFTGSDGVSGEARPPPYSLESTSMSQRSIEHVPVALPHPQTRTKSRLPGLEH